MTTFAALVALGMASPMVDDAWRGRTGESVAVVQNSAASTTTGQRPKLDKPQRKRVKAKSNPDRTRLTPPPFSQNMPDIAPDLPVLNRPPVPQPQPTLTLQHKQVLEKLTRNGVTGASVNYHSDCIEFAGRKTVAGFIGIPFRMMGHFVRSGGFLSFQIDSLSIRGSPASESRIASAQDRMRNMVEIPKDPAPSGNPERGGRVDIKDTGRVVYSQPF